MYIKEIKIKNFKSFKEITFQSNPKFNVLIGENNIGKSTIFEALLLWEHTFKKIINSKKNAFLKADGKNSYISFSELSFLRLINDTDLFYESPNISRITLIICVDVTKTFSLTFEIGKPKSISNSYIRFQTINHKEFENFSIYMKSKKVSLDKVLFIYQTKPVSNILSREPFMNKGQILKKISLGKSGEVLRNKILNKKGNKRQSIESQISNVLGQQVTFNCLNENKHDDDEYIDLKVNNLDIHLQGSGFLQIAEIFSTVEYLENAINILLIDEPDSHIHSKLQNKLLEELRLITNTQTFIISHNDNFVNEINSNELFYINQEAKRVGQITKLDIENFDVVKKDLGGVIIALDKLNYCNRICFVEGDDDIKYLENIKNRILSLEPDFQINNIVTFYYLRGKDNLLSKIEYNKRFLSQLFKDKQLLIVYDKDFTPTDRSEDLKNNIERKLGRNSKAIYHKGYCIESLLFTDIYNLSEFLSAYYSTEKLRTYYFITEYIQTLKESFRDVTSEVYKLFEQKFNGQLNNSRPELQGVLFADFIRDCYDESFKPHFLFNKHLIKDFFVKYSEHFEINYDWNDKSDEYYASSLLNNYIARIEKVKELNPDILSLINEVYN